MDYISKKRSFYKDISKFCSKSDATEIFTLIQEMEEGQDAPQEKNRAADASKLERLLSLLPKEYYKDLKDVFDCTIRISMISMQRQISLLKVYLY